ncbi:hypothetical protein M427DRAFT_47180 [Gonapodya prolifera JEL478]|uniref:Uncharacterized protein n=1 Tax=Gonapodya prolifera (strain JEL478) TaxID=1344416 RepID=A0A139A4H3_GONPJ|nr:hypothetical protein M427DRAFT_47180 [Gonapodya prolifera JEL478]|eukprot:KXS11488.1 hypothetical protein M427DRAFT_47180 [Gonapodya prolifera JEL478]
MAVEQIQFPIPVRQLQRVVADVPTEVLVALFADRWLVLVSQVGNVGNLFLATLDNPDLAFLSPQSPPITVRPLLGGTQDEVLLRLYASQILQRITAGMAKVSGMGAPYAELVQTSGPTPPPLVVGLALKRRMGEGGVLSEADRTAFNQILDCVCECGGW